MANRYRAIIGSKSIVLMTALLSACSTPDTVDATKAEVHEVPNCILPGQIRKLGDRTFIAPRQAVSTTPTDCDDRGGDVLAVID